MDLLCGAYADDDESDEPKALPIPSPSPSSKRKRSLSQNCNHHHHQNNKFQSSSYSAQSSINVAAEGRYVSKRERAILSSSSSLSRVCEPPPPPVSSLSPVIGSIADSDIPCDIFASLRCRTTVQANRSAGRGSIPLIGHTNAVSSVQWSKCHGLQLYLVRVE